MERINNRVSIGSNYLFNDEKEYVYRVYDEYINMERESLRYIKTQLTKYFKVKLKAVKKVFKDYKDVKEKELIVITNPSGMKISLNDKNYGNSPVRIKGLKYREVQVTATDPWLGEVTAKVELEEKRNFLFLESARLKEYSLRVEAKPAKALRSSMFELSWSTVEGAYQYTVQVNAEGGDNKKTLFEFYGLKKNKYRFKKQLEGGKTYSYRIYAENKNGIKSGWSNEAKFEGQLEWKKAANFYPFENSHCHANVIFKNRMWVIGGYDTSAVWYSEDGINWNLATAAAPFGRRANHEAVVFKNRIWVIGGRRPDNINNGQSLNDIWYSEDGVNWKPATRSAPFKPPNGIRVIVYKNKMWIIGQNSDVWYSTNGANWRRTTA